MASAIGCKDCLDSQRIRDSRWQKVHVWGLSGKPSCISKPVSCFISGLTSLFLILWIEFCSLVYVCLMVSNLMLFRFLSKAQYSCSCCRCYCLVWFPQLGCHTIPIHPHSLNDLTVTVQSKKCQNLFFGCFFRKQNDKNIVENHLSRLKKGGSEKDFRHPQKVWRILLAAFTWFAIAFLLLELENQQVLTKGEDPGT